MPAATVKARVQVQNLREEGELIFFNPALPPAQRSLRAIAEKLGVAPGTVRNWASDGKWTERRKAALVQTNHIAHAQYSALAEQGVTVVKDSIELAADILAELKEKDDNGEFVVTLGDRVIGFEKTSRALKPLIECMARLTGEEERSKIRVSQSAPNKPTIHAQNVAVIGGSSDQRPTFWGGQPSRLDDADEGSDDSGEGSEMMLEIERD